MWMSTVIIDFMLLSHFRTPEFNWFDINRSILCSSICTRKTRGMCFNSYFIGGMYFRLMQTRFSQTHSRLTINFFYLDCIFIFKNIRIIRLVHFAKRSEAFNVSLACFIIGSLTQVFSHVLFSLHPPKVTVRAIKRSISQIVVVSFWFFLMILVSSGFIYFLERGYFDENSKVWFRVNPNDGQVEAHSNPLYMPFIGVWSH